MKPRFINNLPVENFFGGETGDSNVGANLGNAPKLRLYLQGFAEIFILQTATDQALLT